MGMLYSISPEDIKAAMNRAINDSALLDVNFDKMTDDEVDTEIQRGLDSAKAGNYRPVSEARAEFRRKHARWTNTLSK